MRTHGLGPRLPPNYRLVHEVVGAQPAGVHASAADIFSRARAIKASLGYSTVYRALGRLCSLGLVLEVHVPGVGAALYEPARSRHGHFVCAVCGGVEDIDWDMPDADLRSVVQGRGGAVDEIVLTVHGRCAACLGREARADAR